MTSDPLRPFVPVNPDLPAGYAAGQSARTGLAQGADAAAGAFDSTAWKVGGTLSTAENAVRGFVGASPAIASGAPVKAVDDYMANNPTVAGGPRPGFTPSSGNMAGGYDLNALAAKAKPPASAVGPVQPATPKPLDPLAAPTAFNPQPLSLSATAPAKPLDPLRSPDWEELKRRRTAVAL